MGVLYVDRKDSELRADVARILVYEQGRRSASVPLAMLDRIVLAAGTTLDTRVLGLLAEHNIALVVLNPRKPERTAVLTGRNHNDVSRRVGQYAASQDEPFRVQFARGQVLRKLIAQHRLLERALKARPDLRHDLFTALRALEDRIAALRDPNAMLTRERVRGIEGAGAAAYFRGFTRLFAASLNFENRNRRPPRDPVNACLSLGYTLLNAEATQALHGAGLDPMVGLYHDLAFGRDSLAADLIEPFRPRLDEWVWRLFQSRLLRVEQFSQDKGACLLNKEGRGVFYRQYEGFVRVHRRHLKRTAMVLAKGIANRVDVSTVDEPNAEEDSL